MSIKQQVLHQLWIDGRKMALTTEKVDPTTLRITWTLPAPITAYNGAVVLLSEAKFDGNQYPSDGTRYTASSNWTAPADSIGNSQVVAAFYGFFGDSTTQTSVDVSNIDPNKVYFASIHAASNVLQYYSVGVQSYPVDLNRYGKSDTYAGSIPSSVGPPANPVNGQIYFDPTIEKVFVWNDTAQAWIESTSRTVITGLRPPIGANYVFLNIQERPVPNTNNDDGVLKAFVGGTWITCNAINTRIKFGATWIPLGQIHQDGILPTSANAGDIAFINVRAPQSGPASGEIRVFTTGQWFLLSSGLIQFETAPGVWTNLILSDPAFGVADPVTPQIGDFFYASVSRDLLTWDGNDWSKADVDDEGIPTTDKVGIGTDGSYDDRLRLMKILKGQLGWPKVCVELEEEQFNIAIDNALEEFRRRADNAYKHQHILFTLKKNQTVYYLNDPRLGTDKIVTVLKIHRINLLGVSALSSEANIYAQAFFHQFYQGSMVDTLSIHLMHQMSETYEKIFAGNLVFTWDESSRQLNILRRILHNEERVVIECAVERTEQELLQDRWAKQWLQAWAHAELKEMLGAIRTKYGSLPGAAGSLTLNGDLLISEARLDFEELLRQINDYEVGNSGVNWGNTAFMIG